ncbi:MAG TPA: DUF1385 domain-containing protein [Clostridia bacterium]|nr:DUF1385 domain-containing protein [Clostridia bacterium]
MEAIKINGGRAHLNGVSIYSNKGFAQVLLDQKKHQYKIRSGGYKKSQTKFSKFINFLSKIPFLRSFVLIYKIIRRNWKKFIKALLIYSILVVILFFSDSPLSNQVDSVLNNEKVLYLGIMIIVAFLIKITRVSNYHGAEHMVINYFNENKDLTFKGLENISRVSTHCGSLLVIETFIIFYMISFFSSFYDLNFLIAYMIGYEVFKGQYKIFKPIMFMSYLIQKYFLTAKPSVEELNVAKLALKKAVLH